MGLKRSRSADFPCHTDDPDMHILVAGQEQPLLAHYQLLRHCATCVRDLPRTADSGDPLVWDLRNLVLEGETSPVSAEVVQRWLDLVYSRLDAGRRVRRINDLDEARPLLVFADACGTSQVVIDDIGRRLLDNPDLGMTVSVGEGPQRLAVKLALRGTSYLFDSGGGLCRLQAGAVVPVISSEQFAPHASASAFPSAVCSALESWLHLAGRLRMVPLCRMLLDSLKEQLFAGTTSPVWPAFSSIFSLRVLECMPRELLFEALVRDSLQDRPAGVRVEAEGAKVTLDSPLTAAFFNKPLNATESMNLGGTLACLGSLQVPMHVVLGGVRRSATSRVVQDVIRKACEEAE